MPTKFTFATRHSGLPPPYLNDQGQEQNFENDQVIRKRLSWSCPLAWKIPLFDKKRLFEK